MFIIKVLYQNVSGIIMPIIRGTRLRVTAYGVLHWLCWLWLCGAVHCVKVTVRTVTFTQCTAALVVLAVVVCSCALVVLAVVVCSCALVVLAVVVCSCALCEGYCSNSNLHTVHSAQCTGCAGCGCVQLCTV